MPAGTALTKPQATPAHRIPELDGLRGLALLLILVWHFVAGAADTTQAWGAWLNRAFHLTWTGVDLFFVLSGFLIGGILLDQRDARNLFRVFYARRALRIVPMYYIVVLLFALAVRLEIPSRFPPLQELFDHPHPLWVYLSFTQNLAMTHSGIWGPPWLGVTWTLSVEEQFYLLLPLMIRLIPRRVLPWTLLTLALAAPLARLALLQHHPFAWLPGFVWTPCRADALLAGTLGAWLIRQPAANAWLRRPGLARRAVLLALLIGVIVLHQRIDSFFSAGMMVFGYSWMAVFFLGLILVAASDPHSVAAKVGRWAPLRALGKISYTVYLFHVIMNSLAHGLILGQPPTLSNAADGAVTALALVVTLALAALSWRFFESRLVRLGYNLTYESTPPGPEAPPPALNNTTK